MAQLLPVSGLSGLLRGQRSTVIEIDRLCRRQNKDQRPNKDQAILFLQAKPPFPLFLFLIFCTDGRETPHRFANHRIFQLTGFLLAGYKLFERRNRTYILLNKNEKRAILYSNTLVKTN